MFYMKVTCVYLFFLLLSPTAFARQYTIHIVQNNFNKPITLTVANKQCISEYNFNKIIYPGVTNQIGTITVDTGSNNPFNPCTWLDSELHIHYQDGNQIKKSSFIRNSGRASYYITERPGNSFKLTHHDGRYWREGMRSGTEIKLKIGKK